MKLQDVMKRLRDKRLMAMKKKGDNKVLLKFEDGSVLSIESAYVYDLHRLHFDLDTSDAGWVT